MVGSLWVKRSDIGTVSSQRLDAVGWAERIPCGDSVQDGTRCWLSRVRGSRGDLVRPGLSSWGGALPAVSFSWERRRDQTAGDGHRWHL